MVLKRFMVFSALFVLIAGVAAAGALHIPAGVKEIETEAFCGDEAIDQVTLPEGLERIGKRAFGLTTIRKISLPSSLQYIADDAFSNGLLSEVIAEPGTYAYRWAMNRDLISSISISADRKDASTDESAIFLINITGRDAPYEIIATFYHNGLEYGSKEWHNTTEKYYEIILPMDQGSGEYYVKISAAGSGKTLEAKSKVVHVIQSEIPVTRLSLTSSNLLLSANSSTTLDIEYEPLNTTDTFIWKSNSPDYVTVDGNGIVHALKAGGQATVTVTSSSGLFSASTVIKTIVPVEAIQLNSGNETIAEYSLYPGASTKLDAQISPTSATIKKLVWNSSNKNVAFVDQEGNIEAISEGYSMITATSTDGTGIKGACAINVYPSVKKISLNRTEMVLFYDGYSKDDKIEATIFPESAKEWGLSFYSSDPNIVSIDQTGIVHANKAGTATITVYAHDGSGISATCTIRVISPQKSTKGRLEISNGGQSASSIIKTGGPLIGYVGDNAILDAYSGLGGVSVEYRYRILSRKGSDTLYDSGFTSSSVWEIKLSSEYQKTGYFFRVDFKSSDGSYTYVGEPSQDYYAYAIHPLPFTMTEYPTVDIGDEYFDLSMFNSRIHSWCTDKPSVVIENTSIIKTSDDEIFEVLKTGSTKITVKSSRISATETFIVNVVSNRIYPVQRIETDLREVTLGEKLNTTQQVFTSITPDYATNKSMKWKSSNENIAKVDTNGTITAIKAGTTTITVEATDGSGVKASIPVTVLPKAIITKQPINVYGKILIRTTKKPSA